MKAAGNYILVYIEQKLKNEIELKNGKSLYLNPDYNPFEYRTVSGSVHSVPEKFNDVFEKGDKVYFHHTVVIGKASVIDSSSKIFRVQYVRPEKAFVSYDCAIYLIERDGEKHTTNKFIFVEPIEEEKHEKIGSLYVPQTANSTEPFRGVIRYSNDSVKKELGVDIGDTIVWQKDSEYAMEIDGKIMYRMQADNILAQNVG